MRPAPACPWTHLEVGEPLKPCGEGDSKSSEQLFMSLSNLLVETGVYHLAHYIPNYQPVSNMGQVHDLYQDPGTVVSRLMLPLPRLSNSQM